jgi:copper homeostasis protein
MELELCVASLESARLASTLPIARIETCVALEHGGLTPTTGMVSWIHQTFHELEQHILIRHRAGGFRYTYDEIVTMRNDILEFQRLGVKGIVIGALTADGQLDKDALGAWQRAAPGMDFTFHRAFDEVADWKKTMDQLINMGFKRILTSGQAASVDLGIATLEEMVGHAAGRIEIMAGGGVRPQNIAAVKATGVSAIHFSGTVSQTVSEGSLFAADLNCVDGYLIREILAAVEGKG